MSEEQDYERLSNEELYRLLREKLPELRGWRFTDENRNGAIAILKMIHEKGTRR